MLLRRNLLVVICGVIIASGAVSGTDVVGALGGKVSFGPDKPPPASVSSITWKHIKGGETVKAIEWEDGDITAPNPRFQNITTLDTKTGKITITNLTVEHSGVYTIDISGKEQAQRFTLTVMDPVPKPVIKLENIPDNPDVVYLVCKYTGTVIWNNSAGESLTVHSDGQYITVKNNEGDPANVYTCTLKNAVSEETSDPVNKKDLFNAESAGVAKWIVAMIVVIVLTVVIAVLFLVLYKLYPPFHDYVFASCGGKPCIGGLLSCLDGKNKGGKMENKGNTTGNSIDNNTTVNAPLKTVEENAPLKTVEENAPQKTEEENVLLETEGAKETA